MATLMRGDIVNVIGGHTTGTRIGNPVVSVLVEADIRFTHRATATPPARISHCSGWKRAETNQTRAVGVETSGVVGDVYALLLPTAVRSCRAHGIDPTALVVFVDDVAGGAHQVIFDVIDIVFGRSRLTVEVPVHGGSPLQAYVTGLERLAALGGSVAALAAGQHGTRREFVDRAILLGPNSENDVTVDRGRLSADHSSWRRNGDGDWSVADELARMSGEDLPW